MYATQTCGFHVAARLLGDDWILFVADDRRQGLLALFPIAGPLFFLGPERSIKVGPALEAECSFQAGAQAGEPGWRLQSTGVPDPRRGPPAECCHPSR